MNRYLSIFITMVAAIANAEVAYFSSDSIVVPEGEIVALEARVSQPCARVGEAKLSGWKITWPDVEITLTFDFRSYVDGISDIEATLQVNDENIKISKYLNVNGGFNTIAVEWHEDGRAHILVGERKLVDHLAVDSLPRPASYAVLKPVGEESIVIQDFIVETDDNAFGRLTTGYTAEELMSANRWLYLDRQNDPKTAIVGGRYALAQVGDDLIYIDGAVTNAAHWKPGMLKGRLFPTGFVGYYKLQWYDASGRKMPGENYAEHDSVSGVLKLNFPELGATLRFAGQQ